MTDSDQLSAIYKTLAEHGEKLDQIGRALSEIAVQNQRINDLQSDVRQLWAKWDKLVDPETGVITTIQKFQASCPRDHQAKQMKFFWWFVGGTAATLIGVALTMFKMLSMIPTP